MKTKIYNLKKDFNSNIIQSLGKSLKDGSVGIFPTDTVYGIGCNAFDENSIIKIFNNKNRAFSKPINVLISNLDMLNLLVDNISKEEEKLIKAFWPGALTIIFSKKKDISNLLTANLNTIGIRMPDNKIALSLIDKANIPIATTSVNISGKPSAIDTYEFINSFKDKVNFIIDNGPTDLKQASTIVQIVDSKAFILRKGSISEEQINKILK